MDHINQIDTMCGRFSTSTLPINILNGLSVSVRHWESRDQVYPKDDVNVVFRDESNEITLMKWGWERSFSPRPLINTRGLEAWTKKTWAQAIQERRCIIPAKAFYEWDENQPKGKRDRYRISSTQNDGFAMGGLYEINKDGELFMSILTTLPNEKMSKIHHRMPVILNEENYEAWFTSTDRKEVEFMMKPLADSQINIVKG